MTRQPKLCPKSHVPGYPDGIYDFPAALSLSQLESGMGLNEEKHDQRVFRVRRKHVQKACDRCRVKKTKCDGKQPCNRCSAYNHPCLFRERKATQAKVYSRGFVEMLESHHSLVVKALRRLYKLCVNKEGFPGDPLVEAPDGYPLTHAILDRLGLIKQAEENSEDADEDTEDIQYLRFLSSSTDCSATADPSPEPATPPDPSPNTTSPAHLSPRGPNPFKWEFQSDQPGAYHGYTQELQGVILPRPALEPGSLSSEAKCSDAAPVSSSVTNNDNPNSYFYYADGRCNADESANIRLPPVVTTSGPVSLPAVTAAGMPVDMVGDYNLHLPDHQPMYPPLTSGWTYPCG